LIKNTACYATTSRKLEAFGKFVERAIKKPLPVDGSGFFVGEKYNFQNDIY